MSIDSKVAAFFLFGGVAAGASALAHYLVRTYHYPIPIPITQSDTGIYDSGDRFQLVWNGREVKCCDQCHSWAPSPTPGGGG